MIGERQMELMRELKALSTSCFICNLSEEKKKCEILIASKCDKHICIQCYKEHKDDACMICAQKIEEHYKKTKMFDRSSAYDEASKMYNRQFKIRSNEEFESLDFDLINLMAYYNAHPQVSVRKKYEQVEKEIKRILQNKKREQRAIISESSKVKQAKVVEKIMESHQNGIQSCGYNRRYDKGINLIRVGWGYSALSPQEFQKFSQLIKKEKGQVKQQVREQEINLLKLSKKSSDLNHHDMLIVRSASE